MNELERLAGSVLCVGFEGDAPAAIPVDDLRALAPGGLIMFARNVTDAQGTRALAGAAAAAAAAGDLPPFVGVDQEGGRVARFVRGASGLPSMMALGAAADPDLARRAGAALAFDVRAFGANVDFAPVLDLANDPGNTVIGTRSLGADPQRAAELGAEVIRGLQSGGVAAVAKHFPGHGATSIDSHLALPIVGVAAATLRERELVTFAAAIAAGVDGIMAGHLLVLALDPDRPATFSRTILTGLLREELGFTGVCFTDAMEMRGAGSGGSVAEGVVRALAAGADCPTICHSLQAAREARDAIVAAVEEGTLSRERLAEASGRVDALRRRCASRPAAAAGDSGLSAEIAHQALRIVRGDPRLRSEEPVNVISFEGLAATGAEDASTGRPSLALALRERRTAAEAMRVPLEASHEMIAHLTEVLQMQPERRTVIVMRRAHLHIGERRAVEALLAALPGAILVSALEPYDAEIFSAATAIVCTFGDEAVQMEALADLLAAR